ncbi:MAG: glucose-6-phosphate dehydrogenase (NADP(+)), partial [Planctomycetota bacterium]
MQEIQPSVAQQDIICAEIAAPPTAMVVFGASGDLTRRKLLVSLFEVFKRGLLNERFYLLGCGRKEISDEQFRQVAEQAIQEESVDTSAKAIAPFINKLYYMSGDYHDTAFYNNIRTKLAELDKKHKVESSVVFYLAVPPFLYGSIVEHLCSAGLSSSREPDSKSFRLVVEKPFGFSLQSAVELNNKIRGCFDESQIYRIDHYLGKETVQNILMFRFANIIYEPLWNRNYIDSV